jgi:hypothetical protein
VDTYLQHVCCCLQGDLLAAASSGDVCNLRKKVQHCLVAGVSVDCRDGVGALLHRIYAHACMMMHNACEAETQCATWRPHSLPTLVGVAPSLVGTAIVLVFENISASRS